MTTDYASYLNTTEVADAPTAEQIQLDAFLQVIPETRREQATPFLTMMLGNIYALLGEQKYPQFVQDVREGWTAFEAGDIETANAKTQPYGFDFTQLQAMAQ